MNSSRPVTPPRGSNQKKGKKQILREEILLLHHHHYYQHHHKLSLCCLSIFTMTKTPVLLSCTENTKNFTNFYWTEKSLDNFTIFFSKIFFEKIFNTNTSQNTQTIYFRLFEAVFQSNKIVVNFLPLFFIFLLFFPS